MAWLVASIMSPCAGGGAYSTINAALTFSGEGCKTLNNLISSGNF